jgi:hypothetical protein
MPFSIPLGSLGTVQRVGALIRFLLRLLPRTGREWLPALGLPSAGWPPPWVFPHQRMRLLPGTTQAPKTGERAA